MKSKKEIIINIIRDMISDFLYYDRKEDEDLSVGEIEKAIKNNEITVVEIVDIFQEELIKGLLDE